jgi:hypothetical protein
MALMQQALRGLHTDLARHSPGDADRRDAVGTVLAATQDLLDYKARIPAARAAARAAQRRLEARPRLLAIAGGLAAAAALVIVLAGVGVTGTAAVVAAVGALLTSALIAAGASDTAGEDPLDWRRATAAAGVAGAAMIVAAWWWSAAAVVVLAIGLCLRPLLPEAAEAEARAGD